MIINRYHLSGLECYFHDSVLKNYVKIISIKYNNEILFFENYDEYVWLFDIRHTQILDGGKLKINIETSFIYLDEIMNNFSMSLQCHTKGQENVPTNRTTSPLYKYPYKIKTNIFYNFKNLEIDKMHNGSNYLLAQLNNYKNYGIIVFYNHQKSVNMEPLYWFYKGKKDYFPMEIFRLIEKYYVDFLCSEKINKLIENGYSYF